MAFAFDELELANLCLNLQTSPGGCITFPGGIELCASIGIETGDIASISRSLLAMVNTALIPLQPIFNIIDVLKKAIDCIQAIPGIIGPPPDPSGVVECIPDLLKALEKILAIIPPYSIFPLVKGIIDALVLFLGGLLAELHAVIRQQKRILASAFLAADPGNFELKTIVDCAVANMDVSMQNLNASLLPLNRLLGIVNAFGKLAGITLIPDFEHLGDDAEAALAPIDAAVNALRKASSLIPA